MLADAAQWPDVAIKTRPVGLPEEIAEIAFVALPQSSRRDWRLTRIGAKAFEVLQPTEPRGMLTKLGDRSVAVRLRRLLAHVGDADEPVAALFDGKAGHAFDRGQGSLVGEMVL